MRLELGTFPVSEVSFGSRTRWADGLLEVNREELLEAVTEDPRIQKADLQLARPGESVRIWPVRDVIEPRAKIEGPGVIYPGICGRPIATVGEGRTHRLAGVGVVEVSETPWHEAGGDPLFVFLDMSGPWAEIIPQSSLFNLCVVVEPDPALGVDARNDAVHTAALTVSDRLAETTKTLEPPQSEVFELTQVDPSLPKVVYILCPALASGHVWVTIYLLHFNLRPNPANYSLAVPSQRNPGWSHYRPLPDRLRYLLDRGQQSGVVGSLPAPRE